MKKIILMFIITIMGSILVSCSSPISPEQYGTNLIGTWRLESKNGTIDFKLSGELLGKTTINLGTAKIFCNGEDGGTGFWSITDNDIVTIEDLHQQILMFRIDKMTSENIEGSLVDALEGINPTAKIELKRVR